MMNEAVDKGGGSASINHHFGGPAHIAQAFLPGSYGHASFNNAQYLPMGGAQPQYFSQDQTLQFSVNSMQQNPQFSQQHQLHVQGGGFNHAAQFGWQQQFVQNAQIGNNPNIMKSYQGNMLQFHPSQFMEQQKPHMQFQPVVHHQHLEPMYQAGGQFLHQQLPHPQYHPSLQLYQDPTQDPTQVVSQQQNQKFNLPQYSAYQDHPQQMGILYNQEVNPSSQPSPYEESLFSNNQLLAGDLSPQKLSPERSQQFLQQEQRPTERVVVTYHQSAFRRVTPRKPQEHAQSVFNVSENIKMLLLGGGGDENKGSHQALPNKRRSDSNILLKLTLKIVETLRNCNNHFNYQPFTMNPKRELTQPSEGVLNNGYDNSDNDYILRVSECIITPEAKEYEILDMLGKGTFGQVVKCEFRQTKEMVAIKVIKNKKAFKNQGVVEIKILDIINRVYDPSGDNPLVRMIDFFVFREHLCIVFELLSASIYDVLKKNMFQGLSLNFSRLIISQILDALKVVKEAKLIHCDLKPENILFKSKENPNLKVIDFGSACFEGLTIFQYIQSRYYRSPEVLLGLPYDAAIDMWSLGCICAELFLGIPIFPGNSEYDQLARIIEIVGPIPQYMIHRAKKKDQYFLFDVNQGAYRFKTMSEFQLTTGIILESPKRYIENFSSLDDMKNLFLNRKQMQQDKGQETQKRSLVVLESEMNAIQAFIHFLKGVLAIDKDQRWTPIMAMGHPFITRETFTGQYNPKRELDKSSNHDTIGEDTMSERSSSSKDSKDYKAGSCPSKILYPQTQSLPQYMQTSQQTNPTQQIQPQFIKQKVTKGQFQSTPTTQASEYVFYGSNRQVESHRPPILSIPDEFFKGFMFGRLDQILSMTKEQLAQFIHEQRELQFRQQMQRQIMLQQQAFQQHMQQHQFFMGQQRLIAQAQLQGMDPSQIQALLAQHQSQYLRQQSQGFIPQQQQPQQQIQQPNSNPLPQEQIIYNPPPYIQQKVQLHQQAFNEQPFQQAMAIQQHSRRLMTQNYQGNNDGGGGINRGKAGSWHAPAAGLQAQKYNHYYNQINNPGQVIGRQGQMFQPIMPPQFNPIGFMQVNEKQFFQNQFYPVPVGLQPNVPLQSQPIIEGQVGLTLPSPRGSTVGSFQKIELRTPGNQGGQQDKRHRFGMTKVVSNESLQNQVIEEEKDKGGERRTSSKQNQDQMGIGGLDTLALKESIPYPDTKLLGLASQNSFHSNSSYKSNTNISALHKKPSTENLHMMSDPWGQAQRQPGFSQPGSQMLMQQRHNTPPQHQRQFPLTLQQQQQQQMLKQQMIGGQGQTYQLLDQSFQNMMQARGQHPSPKYQGAPQQAQYMSSGGQAPHHHYQNQDSFGLPGPQQAQQQQLQSRIQQIQSNNEGLNTSFSSIKSGGSNQFSDAKAQSQGFLNKLQSQKMSQQTQPFAGLGVAAPDKGLFNTQLRASGGYTAFRKDSKDYGIDSSAAQNSYRLRSNSDLLDDHDSQPGDQSQRLQIIQPSIFSSGGSGAGLWSQPVRPNQPFVMQQPIKLDQPLHRLAKGQQPGSLTLEQIIQQRQAQDGGYVQQAYSGEQNSFQFFDQKSPSPLKANNLQQAFTYQKANSGGLSANHNSSNALAKNLTPIVENRFIEDNDMNPRVSQAPLPNDYQQHMQQDAQRKSEEEGEDEEDQYDFHGRGGTKQKHDPYSSSSSRSSSFPGEKKGDDDDEEY